MAKEIIHNDIIIKDYVILNIMTNIVKNMVDKVFVYNDVYICDFCFCHEWVTICKWRVSDECAVFIAGF